MKFKWEKPEMVDLSKVVAYGDDTNLVCAPVGSSAARPPEPFICIPVGGDIPPPKIIQ